jgi:protein-disulfide isomerase
MGCISIVLAFVVAFLASFIGATGSTQVPEQAALPTVDGDFARYADIPQSRAEDGAFVLGEADAPVTIIIFEDFFCPHCQALQPTVDQVIETYVRSGAAKYEWRAFATAGGEQLNQVARLLECAENQRAGAFWEGYLLTYGLTQRGVFPENAAGLYAERLELDADALRACEATASQVDADESYAYSLGVMGTPGIYIRYGDGEVVEYDGGRSLEDFGRVIEDGKNGKPNKENEA